MLVIDAELEGYLVQILEQSKNGIIITDPSQKNNPVIFVNKITCDRFEYERDDFLGNNCNFLQGEDKNQEGLEFIKNAVKNKEPVTTVLRNYTKSGKLIYNEISISPIFKKDKEVKYFLGVQKDITNEMKLEEEKNILEQDKIDNAQFNAIGKLSAGLSHEINTPLTIIKGNLEMLKCSVESLQQSDEKEDILEDMSIIENNLIRIKNVTESIREVADTNKFEIKSMNLYRALVIALRLTHNKAKAITKINLQGKSFDMYTDRENKEYIVYGDYRKLEQAFIAIIDNALDQLEINSDFKNNTLDISIVKDDKQIKLCFDDNGGGVEPELLPNIFKPFSNSKKHKGLGIGLSVVKKIMDEHGFNIDIYNHIDGARVAVLIST